MRILLALDKFKGSLTAKQVIQAVGSGLKNVWPEAEFESCPIADGGDGFVSVLVDCLAGHSEQVEVCDAQGRHIFAQYGFVQVKGEKVAVMEMSEASGLAKVQDLDLNPASANTFGTGQLILDACKKGAKKIFIGIGGSATNDGGAGALQALGFRFFDEDHQELKRLPQELDRLEFIEAPKTLWPEIIVACDVNNPLLGKNGATRVYGPQKGVVDFEWFETRLAKLSDVADKCFGHSSLHLPGAGAAGGLGFGLSTFLQARLQGGFEMVSDLLELERRISQADLVITGEGRMDAQSLYGKGPVGVARLARKYGKTVIGVAGGIQDEDKLAAYFDGLMKIKTPELTVEYCMTHAAELLEETIAKSQDWLKERMTK